MELTFVTDLGHTFVVEIDPNMELENVMALLEAECGIPPAEQSISYDGREISNPKATMRQLGVDGANAMLQLRRKVQNVSGGSPVEHDAEMMRLQILGDPELMRQIQETQPEIAAAAMSDPARFAELLRQTRERVAEAELQRQREIATLNADPFDIEAQRKIEEAIRRQAVMENMEHAMEYAPESFGRVTMLYIPVEVNGHPVKAFVDSGAQTTIMSPEMAESCGIMRLLDTRFAGIAMGVGTAKILGRVHSAQLKIADLHLPCSFTIMEGRDVDLLFGLDMLKSHQACIDLEKDCLRVQGREVKFLPEHELPEKARTPLLPPSESNPTSTDLGASASASSSSPNTSRFPGGGHTLGSAPTASAPPAARPGGSKYPESSIQTLMGLGCTRDQAIGMLDAAGGNVDVAASLMFQ